MFRFIKRSICLKKHQNDRELEENPLFKFFLFDFYRVFWSFCEFFLYFIAGLWFVIKLCLHFVCARICAI